MSGTSKSTFTNPNIDENFSFFMVEVIVAGRDIEENKKIGTSGLAMLGKHFVKTGDVINLSNEVMLDLVKPHVILISGKRGTGKSYTLGALAENMTFLRGSLKKNLCSIIFDTMGIFWTMKFPNTQQEDLLKDWELEPTGVDVNTLAPYMMMDELKARKIPIDRGLALKADEFLAEDWCRTFSIDLFSPAGTALERAIRRLETGYNLDQLTDTIKNDTRTDVHVRDGLENRLDAAKDWGVFSDKGMKIEDFTQPGKVNVVDVSSLNWEVRAMIVGTICNRVMDARMTARKIEEIEAIRGSTSRKEGKVPMTWIVIDEAHELLPLQSEGETTATKPLVRVLREGRQPGVSLVLATQQPGKIHTDVHSQSDILLSHRVTSMPDIDALNKIMGTYMAGNLESYIRKLPRLRGSAILMDDNSEKVYPLRVRPRVSWHGGESALALSGKEL
jgi:hypothetical protein